MTKKDESVQYTTILIFAPDVHVQGVNAIVKKINSFVQDGDGSVVSYNYCGLRKLAYQIKKVSQGRYYAIHFNGDPSIIVDIERYLRLKDGVLRVLTLSNKKGVKPNLSILIDAPQSSEEKEFLKLDITVN